MSKNTNKQFIVVGLGYGDEGKGVTTAAICKEYGINNVIKFSGGCQSSHNVVYDDGKSFAYSQIGAGAAAGADTYIGPDFLMSPTNLWREKQGFYDKFTFEPAVYVHEDTPIVTPYHRAMNRIEEHVRKNYNTCGEGIGHTRQLHRLGISLRAKHLSYRHWKSFTKGYPRLLQIRDYLRQSLADRMLCPNMFSLHLKYKEAFEKHWPNETAAYIYEQMYTSYTSCVTETYGYANFSDAMQSCVCEGGQGVLLSEHVETPQWATYSDTTARPAIELFQTVQQVSGIRLLSAASPKVIGCVRWYLTRHGSGLVRATPYPEMQQYELHNNDHGFQGKFRCFRWNVSLLQEALAACPVSSLAVSHLDLVPSSEAVDARGLPSPFSETENYRLPPVSITASGARVSDRKFHH